MHLAQKEFCMKVKWKFPSYFRRGVNVLDCGSQDINGNNRYLFPDSNYTGIDIGPGRNVDIVTPIHLYKPDMQYQTIISTECFEHDMFLGRSLRRITELLSPGGLFLFTCATTGRHEHGTDNHLPHSSPHTRNYYKNVTEKDVRGHMDMFLFDQYAFEVNKLAKDLYFWGIKA